MTLLMPYVTGGVTPNWVEYAYAYQDAGADLIEVGLPFSDPMLDGVTIQRASEQALARGATADSIHNELTAARLRVPVLISTYANLAVRPAVVAGAVAAGAAGLIVPDLPLDEMDDLDTRGLDLVLLAAPDTPDDRLARIAARSRGYVYAVSVMGTTGERATLGGAAATLAARIKALTDLPVLIGFGVSGPESAAAAGRAGDGVVVGAALMRKVLDGATAAETGLAVTALRHALDDPEVPAGTAYAQVSGHRG
jgi:tryptophan synthase alpha chain